MRSAILSNIIEITSGYPFISSYFNDYREGLPLIRVRDVNSKFAGIYYSGDYKDEFVIRNGDILVSLDGDFRVIKWDNGKALLNQRVCKITTKRSLNEQYLLHFLPSVLEKIHSKTTYTTVKHLSVKTIKAIKIPLPPLDDQKRIASLLTQVEQLIAKRKESIELLDELLKSTFLEMFGDPVRNEKGWEKKRFDYFSQSRLGKMRDKQFISGNHLRKYLGNSNVQWFNFRTDELLEMDFNEKERETFRLDYGDLLVCEGGDIGRCAIWKNNLEDCYFQKALHRVRMDNNIAVPEYVQFVLYFYSIFNGFKNVKNKATIPHLTGAKLKETSIPLPPLDLQRKFALIVNKTEAVKSLYQKNLDEMENLYGSLSQRAFKGELDLRSIPLDEVLDSHEVQAEAAQERLHDEDRVTVEQPENKKEWFSLKNLALTAAGFFLLKKFIDVLETKKEEPESFEMSSAFLEEHINKSFVLEMLGKEDGAFSFPQLWGQIKEAIFSGPLDKYSLESGWESVLYSHLKERIFLLLEDGRVTQTFDDDRKKMILSVNL